MSTHYSLWLDHTDDWRPLRDLLFDACKSTRFWTGPSTRADGPPDAAVRDHYGVYNDYSIVDLFPVSNGGRYRANLHVFFTFNNKDGRLRDWESEVIDAAAELLTVTEGDAVLDWDNVLIWARQRSEKLVVNDFSKLHLPDHSSYRTRVSSASYGSLVRSSLERRNIPFVMGPIESD